VSTPLIVAEVKLCVFLSTRHVFRTQQQQQFREVLQAAAAGGGDVRGPLGAARLVANLGQLPFPHTHDTGRQLRHLRAT